MTFSALQEQKAKEKAAGSGHKGVKQSAGELRLQKGVHPPEMADVAKSRNTAILTFVELYLRIHVNVPDALSLFSLRLGMQICLS